MKDRLIVLAVELQTRWKFFLIGLVVLTLFALLTSMPFFLWLALGILSFGVYGCWYTPAQHTYKVVLKLEHWKFILEHASPLFQDELNKAFPLTLKDLKSALEKAEEALREQQKAETTAQVSKLFPKKED